MSRTVDGCLLLWYDNCCEADVLYNTQQSAYKEFVHIVSFTVLWDCVLKERISNL